MLKRQASGPRGFDTLLPKFLPATLLDVDEIECLVWMVVECVEADVWWGRLRNRPLPKILFHRAWEFLRSNDDFAMSAHGDTCKGLNNHRQHQSSCSPSHPPGFSGSRIVPPDP